jgi:hypothetical protein
MTLSAYISIVSLGLLLSLLGATIAGSVLVITALTVVFHYEIAEAHRRATASLIRTSLRPKSG